MRLLDTETQELNFFAESRRARYAILSHTWEDDEILFADIVNQDRDWRQRPGAHKVLGSCQLAREQGYNYIWVDTCCIDKSSSAELSEAINSMFDWYMDAEVCYVYLTDVAEDGSIAECRWFKRGWTLQELIAPTSVDFYDKQWNFINDKISMSSDLASITGIDELLLRCGHSLNPPLLEDHHMQEPDYFFGKCSCGRDNLVTKLLQLQDYCVAQKMSWASKRKTTRGEDIAYCLLGLFRINMPLLYGEGRSRAFFRLQKEILETTHDQSILAIDSLSWKGLHPALAPGPYQFSHSGVFYLNPYSASRRIEKGNMDYDMITELTKDGVSVNLLVVPDSSHPALFYGVLDVQITGKHPLGRLAIPLHPVMSSGTPPTSFHRGSGLFEISPEHPNHARDFRVSTGRLDSKRLPDRRIRMRDVKRKKVIILHHFDHSGYRTYKKGPPVPIRCIGYRSSFTPYSVEFEIPGYAIL